MKEPSTNRFAAMTPGSHWSIRPRALLMASGGAAALLMSANAAAQTVPPPPPPAPAPEAAADDIVVTGIRASVEGALNAKRNAGGFVDVINAEDVGKLPDQNIAEALQRVTGVQIQRSRGEGDFISIRGLGPNFVRGEVNGRTLISGTESRDGTRSGGQESSTGRETNFDLLPSEIISSVEVVKSTAASQVEGGIGGLVNVRTQRPLKLGTELVGSAKGTYRDLNGAVDPSASGLASWRNKDRTFGILAAVAYSQRSIREESADSFGWLEGFGFLPRVDTDANGTGDRSLAFPFAYNPQSVDETRRRITAQGTIEWAPTDGDHFLLDVLYSHRDIKSRALNATLVACCGFDGNVNGNGVTNPDGSIQIPGISITGNSAVGFPTRTRITTNTDDQSVKDDVFSVGGNYTKTINDWALSTDISYAKSVGNLAFDRVSLRTITASPFTFSTTGNQLQFAPVAGGPDLTNIASYNTNNADVIRRRNNDDEFAAQADAVRSLPDSGFFSSLKFGVHYRVRNVSRNDATSFGVNNDSIAASGLGGAGVVSYQGGPFVDGTAQFPFAQLRFADVAAGQAYLAQNRPGQSFVAQYSPATSYRIKETTFAGYAQADIDTQLGSIPLKGNLGVRVIQTKTNTTGFQRPFQFVVDPVSGNGTINFTAPDVTATTFNNSYVNVLPSLNLSAEVERNLIVRFAASRSVTRPTFQQLSPGLSGINPTQRFANSGNPSLQAYESTNVDLGGEWYFAKGSAIYVSLFTKQIDNFVGIATAQNVNAFGVNFASLSQPLNQGSANISGVEAGYQHTFPFGLGYILNATYIDSSAKFTSGNNSGRTIPFEGVSKFSYNATIFFERGGFSSRLAYSHRSEYVILSSDVFGNQLINAPYGQLDGSVSYDINKNFTVFGNAVNLTSQPSRIYNNTTVQPVSYSVVGARYEAGVRIKF